MRPSVAELQNKKSNIINALKNSGWLFSERILKLLVGVFVSVATARYLGPEDFGYLNFSLSILVIFTTISSLGMDNITIRNLNDFPEDSNKILGTTFYFRIITSVMFSIIMIFTGYKYSLNNETFLILLIMSPVLILNVFHIIDLQYQAIVRSKNPVILRTIVFFITSILKIIIIFLQGSLMLVASVTMIETLLITVGLLLLYSKEKNTTIRSWSWSSEYLKSILKDSWPLLFSSLSVILYMKIDQVMLGYMSGPMETGIYSVAVKLAELWYFIPSVIIPSFFPYLNKLKDNETLLYKNFQTMYDLMVILGLVIAIPTTFLSPLIIDLLYGEVYSDASSILSLYIWIGIFVNLGVARTAFLNIKNWPYIHLVSSLLGCIINILLNIILIPRYGALGATLASIFSYWLQAHGVGFFIPKMKKNTIQMSKALFIMFRLKRLFTEIRRILRSENSVL